MGDILMIDNIFFVNPAFNAVINNFLLAAVLIASVSIMIFIFIYLYKMIKNYWDTGDVRTTYLCESYLYLLIVVLESMIYMKYNTANDFCIISMKLFTFVNTFVYLKSRLSGRAMIKSNKQIASIILLSITTFFWASIFFFALTTYKQYEYLFYDEPPFDKLMRIVRYIAYPINGDYSNVSFFICAYIPIIFVIVSILIDIKEDKPLRVRLNSFYMLVPALINFYIVFPYFHFSYVFDAMLLITLVVAISVGMIREGALICLYSNMSTNEMIVHKILYNFKKSKVDSTNYDYYKRQLAEMNKFIDPKDWKDKKAKKLVDKIVINK